jgi:hypothetical protein
MIVSKKSFRSNCLFQAIKHKLKDWRNIKIKLLFYWHGFFPRLHFYWQDSCFDYHFAAFKPWCGKLIFKGDIHRHAKGSLKHIYKKLMITTAKRKIK